MWNFTSSKVRFWRHEAAAGSGRAIAGQSRLEFTFVGRANHAGTTPMHLRYDAIAGAAEWITVVEREANEIPGPGGHGGHNRGQAWRH